MFACNAVYEDRSACPCLLVIRVPDMPTSVFVAGKSVADAVRDTSLQVWIPREEVSVTAVCGASPSLAVAASEGNEATTEGIGLMPDGTVTIPFGSGCPPLYLFQTVVSGRSETVTLEIRPRKAFCTLSLELGGPPGWESPYQVDVRGDVDGFSAGGVPHGGPFHCRLDIGPGEPSAGFFCRLPRQPADAPLWLDIMVPEGAVRSFPLGAILQQCGYDWEAPDLADATLRLDLSVSGIRFFYGNGAGTAIREIVI